ETDSQIASISQAVDDTDSQIATHSQTMTERNGQSASLSQAVTERDMTIQAIQTSSSWKITAPFRQVGRMFRQNTNSRSNHARENLAVISGPSAFFMICSKNILAHARALHNSVRPHYAN